MLETVTLVESLDVAPAESVTSTRTVYEPGRSAVKVGVAPVAASNWPSLSRSQTYEAMSPVPSGSLEAVASSATLAFSATLYGPPALAVGGWFAGSKMYAAPASVAAGPSSIASATMNRPPGSAALAW